MELKLILAGLMKKMSPQMPVTDEQLQRILEVIDEVPVTKGEFVLRQGKVSNYYLLLNGYMRGYTFDEQGNEVTTNFFAGPRAVLDAASFFGRLPSAENIVAISDCRGYLLTLEQLNKLFHEMPEFREFGRAILVRELVIAQEQKLAHINLSAEDRYKQLVERDTELMQHAQLRHIASFLGVTDTSLSRIRRELANKK
ncbi:MAG: Crp/Fnr family transcriptional regulator [Chitinophagaceae bacterium]|nr:Crp/Fnr family transcriptional regulator [Chitinophagaceae bacterium]